MKVKHLLLGIAAVSLMAACGKTEVTETPTTSENTEMNEEAPDPDPVEDPAAPAPQTKAAPQATQTAPAAKKETPAPVVDPCEAKLAAFNDYYAKVSAASNDYKLNKKAAEAKKLNALLDELNAQFAKVSDCGEGAVSTRNKVLNIKNQIK